MGFVVYKMLTECLYKIGTWCHQLDKIIDSDETVMLLMLLTCKKKQQEFFPFMPSKSKHMVKARGECVWQGRAQENADFLLFFYVAFFPFIFLQKRLVCSALRLKLAVISKDSKFCVCGTSNSIFQKISFPSLWVWEFGDADFWGV